MPIHHLHEPIDVFSEWLDDCEAAERGEVAAAPLGGSNRAGGASGGNNMRNVVHDTSQDHYEDDDSVESEGLPEASGLGMNKKRSAEEVVGKSGDGEDGEGGEAGGGNKKQKANLATLGLDESDDDSD